MTSLVFEKLAQALSANQSWPVGIAGDFVRVEACEWPITLALYRDNREIGRMSNVRAGDFVRDVAFDRVTVINGATAQSVTVQIAGGGVGSDRVVGEVSVIEGGVNRTKSGIAMWGSAQSQPVAGNYSHVQLWNPVGSGRRVVVTELAYDIGAQGVVSFRAHNAALTNLGNPVGAKLLGVAAGVAQVRTVEAAVQLGTQISGLVGDQITRIQKFSEPLVLPEGWGVMAVAGVVNTACRGNFQFFEEPL